MTQRERQVERLFKLHYRAMYRLASILLHDDDESKDIVHDVFARLLVEQVELQDDTAQSYLLLSVRNRCLNALRNRNIHEQVHRYLLPVDEVEQTSPEDFERLVDMLQVGINELFPPICQDATHLTNYVKHLKKQSNEQDRFTVPDAGQSRPIQRGTVAGHSC